MKFVAISDTHGRHRLLKNLPEGDVIIHTGDVCKDVFAADMESSAVDFMKWFGNLNYSHKIFIAGNHDHFFENEPAGYIARLIPPGVTYLNDSGISIQGIHIWGSPVTPTFWNWAFNRDRGAAINKHWKMIARSTDLLLTHGPPMGILDQLPSGERTGCADLLKKVKSVHPAYHVFGHIHPAYGRKTVDGTTFLNACLLDDDLKLRNSPLTFEL